MLFKKLQIGGTSLSDSTKPLRLRGVRYTSYTSFVQRGTTSYQILFYGPFIVFFFKTTKRFLRTLQIYFTNNSLAIEK